MFYLFILKFKFKKYIIFMLFTDIHKLFYFKEMLNINLI